jgi:pseudouridine-5'-monophosphatase
VQWQQQSIKGLVSDLDGTLLDTEPLYQIAWDRILGKYGKKYELRLKQSVMGKPEAVGAQMIIDANSLDGYTPQSLLAERNLHMDKLFVETKPMPGAVELVHHLKHACGLPTAIATSSYRSSLQKKMTNNQDLASLFDVVICGDDPRVKKGKPAPDIFLACAEDIGVAPECCLALEDTPTGTVAALQAGMLVIAIPEAGMDHKLFAGAIILPSLEDFDFELLRADT